MDVKTKECPRCGGTGKYSYNQIHGSMCYGCQGKGIVLDTPKKKGIKPTCAMLEFADVGDIVLVAGIGTVRVIEVKDGDFVQKERDPWNGICEVHYPNAVRYESLLDGKTYMRRCHRRKIEETRDGKTWRMNKKTMVWSVVKD